MSAKETKVNKRVFRRIKVKLRVAVCWFPSWHERSKGHSVTCFENTVRIRRLIYPNFFFARIVVEMTVLPQSIVSLVEAMYQSAFLSLEFRLNSELMSSVARHKFKKFVKNLGLAPFQILHRQQAVEMRSFYFLGWSFPQRFHFLNGSFRKISVSI